MTTYRVADLFCGAGGSTLGAVKAVRSLGAEMELVAVNHWPVAIASHQRNHPTVRHYCVDLDAARPEEIVPEGYLDLLMASPECTYFSRARGGKPITDQKRMSAWHVQRWATTLDVRCILVENVPEFEYWGPLKNGRPDPDKRGAYFQAWVQSFWALGYSVEWRSLNAANFGGATTRTRLFVQARKDSVPIRWPEPTHSPTGTSNLFGAAQRWRAAREVIDWTHPGPSLLTRKRPLSLKTRLRIARGLRRFGGALAPYYIQLLDLPPEDAPAVTADGQPEPFVYSARWDAPTDSVDRPLRTCTAQQELALVEPVVRPWATSVDPRRLVEIDGQVYVLDILFRMLANTELARAMGFTDDEITYEFSGTTEEITKQIGNAVEVHVATALVTAMLGKGGEE